MRLGAILYTMGYGGLMLSALMVVPWVVALFSIEEGQLGTFTVGLIFCSFISGSLLLSGYTSRRHRARGIELLLIMVLFWAFLPVLAAIPMLGASQIDGFLAAYFEAVSALTTSGGTALVAPEAEPASLLLWRALLCWLGGLWTLVFAVAVLAPFGIGGITLAGSPLLQHEENATLSARLGRPLRFIAPLYGGITLVGFLALFLTGAPYFDAICLTLSGISTGGMTARSGSVTAYLPYVSQWILAVICFIGAISVPLLLVSTIGSNATGSLRDTELRVFIALMLGYVVVSLIAIADLRADHGVLQTISLHTTAGFNFLPEGHLAQWPMVWVMVPVLIGGMSMSTAGGVKVMRAIILAKDIGSELGKLAYPSSVHPLALEGRRLEEGDFTAAWAFTAVFLLFVTSGVIIMGLLGLSLTDSWPIVLGALTNSLAIVNHLDMPLGFATISGGLQIGIALLMVAGRIELLILMVLFTSTFWRYMR